MLTSIKNISLYIPHVFLNFDKEYIANAFKSFGEIDHIDFIGKLGRNGKEYNAVYIHFKMWHDTQYNRDVQSDLMHSYEIRVYHDRPWYWVVLLNNAKKHIPGGRSTPRDLGESYINGAGNTSDNSNTEPTQKKSLKDPLEPKIDTQLKDEIDALIRDAQIDAEIDAEIEAEIEKMEAQYDEVEALMDENDEHLVYVDGRYIQVIEEENMWLRNEVLQLRQTVINLDHMYQAESAKVRAFSLPIEEN